MSANAAKKVMALVRLATDPAVREEEARTAAVAACRLMRENEFTVVPIDAGQRALRSWEDEITKYVARAARTKPPKKHKPPLSKRFRTFGPNSFAVKCGTCFFCRKQYVPYDFVRLTNQGLIHDACLDTWVNS
jgi:hypothetical protein